MSEWRIGPKHARFAARGLQRWLGSMLTDYAAGKPLPEGLDENDFAVLQGAVDELTRIGGERSNNKPPRVLPTWEECEAKDKHTALETLIHNTLQIMGFDGDEERIFRTDLAAALTEVTGEPWVAEAGE